MSTRWLFRLLIGLAALALPACASIDRIEYPANASDFASALSADDGGGPIRFWAQGDTERYGSWRDRILADREASGLGEPRSILVISGGSDKGAYSAGLLEAWQARGSRPEFDLVTGISTGALIAPFAFLGASEDATLREIYTGIGPDDIYRSRPLGVLLGSPALARTQPLAQLIARHTPPEFLARIAAEHRKGRRLLVMTTHLDAGRGIIWDMGAIAASRSPDAPALFRQILLASASIPGAFPPVLIEAHNGEQQFAEMHVDGGVVSGFFVLPLQLLERPITERSDVRHEAQAPRLWILYNGRLVPEFEVVEGNLVAILQRSLTVVLSAHDRSYLETLRLFARRNEVAVSVCSIEEEIDAEDEDIFSPARMNQFFALGASAATAQESCLDRIDTG